MNETHEHSDAAHYRSKVISYRKAAKLMRKGWKAADLHVHSVFSYDVMPSAFVRPAALYRHARDLGMSFVTITDHDTMDAFNDLDPHLEGLVTGVEVKIRDEENVGHTLHLNVFDLSQVQLMEVEQIASKARDLELLLGYLENEDLPYVYNHPFWFEPLEVPNLSAVPALIRRIPVVEYNMQRVRRKNRLTLALAAKHGRGVVATSDSHTGQIGAAFTLARGDSFRDYFKAVRRGDFLLVANDMTVALMTRQISVWMDSLFSAAGNLAGRRVSTGIPKLDLGLDLLFRGRLDHRPALLRAVRATSWIVSRSRIPAVWHLWMQRVAARQLVRQFAAEI